jgi:thiamine pyrophosphate-dependent acetolactate synthase large subunit-like protein
VAVARAYRWHAERLASHDGLAGLLQEAAKRDCPTLIEMDEAVIMG